MSDFNSVEAQVREFHSAFGVRIQDTPIDFSLENDDETDESTFLLRLSLIREEFMELMEAHEGEDLVKFAKEGCDLVVVIVGTFLSYGIPFDHCFAEVMRSNMSKLASDGMPIIRKDGKVLKGSNYKEPNLHAIIYGNGSG